MSDFNEFRIRSIMGAPTYVGGSFEDLNELWDEAEIIHDLFCGGKTDNPDTTCMWDEEEAEFELMCPWVMPSHSKWVRLAESFRKKGITIPEAISLRETVFSKL